MNIYSICQINYHIYYYYWLLYQNNSWVTLTLVCDAYKLFEIRRKIFVTLKPHYWILEEVAYRNISVTIFWIAKYFPQKSFIISDYWEYLNNDNIFYEKYCSTVHYSCNRFKIINNFVQNISLNKIPCAHLWEHLDVKYCNQWSCHFHLML